LYIQRAYRDRVKSLKARLEFLSDYFDKEKGFLIKLFIQKKSKKTKSLIKKLNMLNDDVRNKILKIYLERCLIDFSIKFNKWRMRTSKDHSSVDQKYLAERFEVLNKKEEYLYYNTDLVVEEGTVTEAMLEI
jgi:hypothetical protein